MGQIDDLMHEIRVRAERDEEGGAAAKERKALAARVTEAEAALTRLKVHSAHGNLPVALE